MTTFEKNRFDSQPNWPNPNPSITSLCPNFSGVAIHGVTTYLDQKRASAATRALGSWFTCQNLFWEKAGLIYIEKKKKIWSCRYVIPVKCFLATRSHRHTHIATSNQLFATVYFHLIKLVFSSFDL